MLPGTFMVYLAMGSLTTVEYEMYTQLACRRVDLHDAQARQARHPAPTFDSTTSRHSRNTLHTHPTHSTSIPVGAVLETTPASLPDWIINETDEARTKRCRQSTRVEELATTYLTTILTLMGLLSACTTAAWGSLSDRIGRKPSLMAAQVADFIAVSSFMLVMKFPDRFGFTFLAAGNALGGLLGGPISAAALTSGYISDCTRDGSRANIFSAFEGFRYAGIALGPILGALAVRWSGVLLLPVYSMLVIRTAFFLALLFLIPESLSASRRRDERLRSQAETAARVADAASRPRGSLAVRVVAMIVRQVKLVFAPLAVLVPKKQELEEDEEHRPMLPRQGLAPGRRDWNLTLVAAAFMILISVPGITPVKIQFARLSFDWGTQEVGFFVSGLSSAKLLFLLVVLPFGVQRLRSKTPLPDRPRPTSTLDYSGSHLAVLSDEQRDWDREAALLKVASDSWFDLRLARTSVLIVVVAHLIMAIPSKTPRPLLLGAFITAFSSGAGPALQSLALALSSPRDAGRVLGSLSVLGTLALLVITPTLFGIIFVLSVEVAGRRRRRSGQVDYTIAPRPARCMSSESATKRPRTDEERPTPSALFPAKAFTVVLRGIEFTLSREECEFDSPNYFTACFLSGFSESDTGVMYTNRSPILFPHIQDWLCGYDVFPLPPFANMIVHEDLSISWGIINAKVDLPLVGVTADADGRVAVAGTTPGEGALRLDGTPDFSFYKGSDEDLKGIDAHLILDEISTTFSDLNTMLHHAVPVVVSGGPYTTDDSKHLDTPLGQRLLQHLQLSDARKFATEDELGEERGAPAVSTFKLFASELWMIPVSTTWGNDSDQNLKEFKLRIVSAKCHTRGTGMFVLPSSNQTARLP
ncbi:hypothetical protein RQP46_001420 [Phenoliferia psychrophenolica]